MSGLDRSITHWTGGPGRATEKDREHYHGITEVDGNHVKGKEDFEDNIVTSDGDYAAHTLRLNTGSAGFAMAGMLNAVESPLDYGDAPITRVQFEAHCKELAKFHVRYGIPVTRETCLTHAEVEPTFGVKQRGKWDLTVLPFEPTIRGAYPVGDYMRERVRSYMPADYPQHSDYPVLRRGTRGGMVKELQGLLALVGHFSGKQDGIFGPLTQNAVIAFQNESGLVRDGVVGAETWAALMRSRSRPKRDVSIDDLRAGGSRTVKAADQSATASGVVGAVGSLDVLTTVADQLDQAQSALQVVQSVVMENWPALIAIAAAVLIWRMSKRVNAARLDDAQNHRNLSR